MRLVERLKRWWAPGAYDDERRSEGEGFAQSDEDYAREKPTTPLIHGGTAGEAKPKDPDDI